VTQLNVGLSATNYTAGLFGQHQFVWHLVGETRLVRWGFSRKKRVTFARCGAELFFLYDVTRTDWAQGRWCKRCQARSPAMLNMLAWIGATG